jgi:hypothetical protein
MPVMCVEGEELLSPDMKGLESGAREPSCKGHVVFMVYVQSGGAQSGTAPSGSDGHDQRPALGGLRVSRDMVRSYI